MDSFLKGFVMLALAVSAHVAKASEEANGRSSEVLGGFMILLGVVALAYVFVFLLRLLAGSNSLGPDEMNAVEFDEFTRSIDDPSWRAPDSWPKR
ncbi:MAG: hypothetical protein ABL900_10310 [Burkholderiaceae bacterium]